MNNLGKNIFCIVYIVADNLELSFQTQFVYIDALCCCK